MTEQLHQPSEHQPGVPPESEATEPEPRTRLEVEPLSGPTEASTDTSPPVELDDQELVDPRSLTPDPGRPPV